MKWKKSTDAYALFFNTDVEECCTVFRLYNKIGRKKKDWRSFFRRTPQSYLVNQFYSSCSGFVQANNIKVGKPEKMVIFGYKDEQFPVLLSAINQHRFIGHSWFRKKDSSGVYVLFVPDGVSLMKEKDWSTVFPQWVAFEKFDFLIGLPVADRECAIIYPQLLDAIQRNQSSERIQKEFSRIFSESIERLATQETENNDDMQLTVYKLITNKNNLAYR
ncbi:MAG: hypothetical protein J0H74_22090 [Chitinophagaceae bacterium]|nr:hypothetical protein [Chitinophagaceae bacterium]